MKIKLAVPSLLIIAFSFSLSAQNPAPLPKTHYVFFYASTDAESFGDSYKEIVVTKIYKDDASTHYLFKVLNLKQRAEREMEQKLANYKDFKKIVTDFSSTEEEAKSKMNKLLDAWNRDNVVVHKLNFAYQNATGQEYPPEY